MEFTEGDLNETDSDSDTVEIGEINSMFPSCQHLHCQSLGPNYILYLSATSESTPYIAAGLSDCSCEVFSLADTQVAKIAQFKEHADKLINCTFSPRNNSLLYSASSDGTVKLWDLRELKGSAITFKDTTLGESSPVKALSSFSVSPCDRLLAAGTELTAGDAFILFWDVRNIKMLGAYWESHTDDITQLQFHPEDSNTLISGSTDGLINIYNLSEPCEDEALQECLNTEALVEDLQWFRENGKWKISCITSTHDLQLWEADGAEPYKRFNRDEISSQIKTRSESTYLVKTHPVGNSLLVLTGALERSLRSFQFSAGKLSSAYQFKENSQRVRSSWLNEHTNVFLTGGEKGSLDVWKPDFSLINTNQSGVK